jgi:hypothetical protein
VEWVAITLTIRPSVPKIFPSKLNRIRSYIHWDFSWFFLLAQNNCRKYAMNNSVQTIRLFNNSHTIQRRIISVRYCVVNNLQNYFSIAPVMKQNI